jgi:hypothetical protein
MYIESFVLLVKQEHLCNFLIKFCKGCVETVDFLEIVFAIRNNTAEILKTSLTFINLLIKSSCKLHYVETHVTMLTDLTLPLFH